MKVLWFTNVMMPDYEATFGAGAKGSGGWLQGLLQALKDFETGVELSVAFMSPKRDRKRIDGVDYYALGPISDDETMIRLLEIAKPEVIHIHGTEGIAQCLPDLVFGAAPIVLSIQGIIEECGKNYLGGLTENDLGPYITWARRLTHRMTCKQIADWWQGEKTEKERKVVSCVKHVIGRTDFDCAWVRKVNPLATYYHVDEIMRPEFYKGVRDGSRVIRHRIYAGSAFAYPLKGGHILLQAMAKLYKKYPDIELRVAAGSCCAPRGFMERLKIDEYHNYLRHLIHNLDLSDCVRLLPSLSAAEVRDELESAELFVLPSFMENSPNSLQEAQLTGTPFVAMKVGGVPSIAGDSGVLVDSNKDFCEGIEIGFELYESAQNCLYMDNRNKPKKIAKETRLIYESILGSKKL